MTAIPIAGAACVYPGAHSLAELWMSVLAQREAFRAIPPHRLDLSAYAPGAAEPAETIACEVAAFVTGYAFPRERYRVPASAFRQVDVAHWLALDVAGRAIADAELRCGLLPRERTGVVVANTLTGEMSRANALRHRWPYVRRTIAEALRARGERTADAEALLAEIEGRFKAPFAPTGDESLAGSLSNTIAGRICNHFDFGGGGHVVDAACASSLVAIAHACNALEAGRIDAAVVGAVDVSLDPFELIGFSRLGALASDAMRVYAREPSGFLPGEGCAFVVLRREARGRVLGRIRGVALSSDGAGGITRPELAGQLRVLRRAYDDAGCDPGEIALFEGHGTGTAVGDEVELRALRALREGSGAVKPAYVGSVKTLVGHTKAAAGLAGLLKTVMALRRGIVPPHPSADPHPALGPALRVTPRALPWPEGRPRLAGVSAFGFGGINAHVVLEGEPVRAAPSRRESRCAHSAQDAELLLIGAADAPSLERKLVSLAEQVAGMSRAELTDLAIASASGALDQAHRAALIIERPWRADTAFALLRERLGGEPFADHGAGVYYAGARAAPRIALLFPGQASPVRADAGALGRRFPLLDAPFGACPAGDPRSTAVAQPAIVAASLAALDALRMLGIEAQVALGHSLGELVALHWAGAFNRATLVALARERGAVLETTCARGAMAALFAGAGTVRRLLRGDAVVACDNADERCVVAGSAGPVAATVDAARGAGIASLALAVTTPFHSPAIERACAPFARILCSYPIVPPARPLISSVLGERWDGQDVATTLVEQLVRPVRFREAVAALGEVDLAMEAGAGATLTALAPPELAARCVALDVGGPSLRGLLAVAGFLYARTGDAGPSRALAAGRFGRMPVVDARRTVLPNPCGSAVASDRPPRRETHCAEPAEQAPAVAPDGPVIEVARAIVARRVELPVSMIGAGARLLEDLHLSSLAAGQVVTELAKTLGVMPPADLLAAASATVGEIAAVFERLQADGPLERAVPAVGVAPWVRRFAVVETPVAAPAPRASAPHDWCYRSNASDALDAALRARLTSTPGAPHAHALLLRDAAASAIGASLLRFARKLAADGAARRALIVLHGAGGASFARSLALERPGVPVMVVTVEGRPPGPQLVDALVVAAEAATTYEELIVRDGHCFAPRLRHEPGSASRLELLGPGDVLLVSGGGKGIAAECAFRRALTSGAALILVGRAAPAADPALASNLERFKRAGIRFRYVPADVRERETLAAGIAAAAAELGPATAILHGAGVNEPVALAELSLDALAETVGVKVDGMRNLLAACDPERVREVVAFGSIIARTGMPGEAHYALANELLARQLAALAPRRTACRFVVAEWSIWSGVGMGERLGRVDALERLGIAPISPEDGVAAYLDLAGDPAASGAIVVSGRCADLPTLRDEEAPPLPLARFLERTLVRHEGIELVVEATLSHGTDPYLGEHRIDGLSVVPGVILIEAMAQAASALLGSPPEEVRDVVFSRPVIVDEERPRVIRVAALRERDAVRLEVRSEETGFRYVHAAAVARRERAAPPASLVARNGAAGTRASAAGLYGGILFHSGRFAGVRAYEALRASACKAKIVRVSDRAWFAAAFPQPLVFGDPAIRDMAIHALQACVPETRVLPAAIGRIARHAGNLPDELVVAAHQTGYDGESYRFDVTLGDAHGTTLETIEGLVLRRSAAAHGVSIPPALIAAAVERRILDAGLGEIRVTVHNTRSGERWEKRPDGRPANGASRTYARGIELRCEGGAGGIDAEFADEIAPESWEPLTARYRDAERCASAIGGEPEGRVRARLWCALEAAKKAESATPAELLVRSVRSDGITIFTTGATDLATLCVETALAAAPLVVAIALPAVRATANAVSS